MPSVKKKRREEEDVKVRHCDVDLEIDLEAQRLLGSVELTLTVERPGLQNFRLHARQLKVCAVYVDGEQTRFDYHNFLDDVMAGAEGSTRQLKAFNVYHKAALEADDMGALVVQFPPSFSADHRLHQDVKLRVEYVVDQPRGGVEFSCIKQHEPAEKSYDEEDAFPPAPMDMTFRPSGPPLDKTVYETLPRRPASAVHAFAKNHALAVRTWLPCINKRTQQCTWTFAYHCQKPNVVVSSGDLTGTSATVRPEVVIATVAGTVPNRPDEAPAAPAPSRPPADSMQIDEPDPPQEPDPEPLHEPDVGRDLAALATEDPVVVASGEDSMDVDSEGAAVPAADVVDEDSQDVSEQEVLPTSTRSRRGQKSSPVSLSRQFSSLVHETADVTRTLRGASSGRSQEKSVSPRRRSPRSKSPRKAPASSSRSPQRKKSRSRSGKPSPVPKAEPLKHEEEMVGACAAQPSGDRDVVMGEANGAGAAPPVSANGNSQVKTESMEVERARAAEQKEAVLGVRELVTYKFELTVPTAAEDIGFVCGPFEVLPDARVPVVTHFCLPGGLPVLKNTVAKYGELHQFMEEYLGNSYPYGSYKQVFVDGCSEHGLSFAGLSVIDKTTMHDSSVIDQAVETRMMQARLLGLQWFGCFTMPKSWADNWLRFGLSGHLMSVYAKKAFGNNEARYRTWTLFEEVVELDVDRPPLYWKGFIHPGQVQELFFLKKSELVMGMIVECVGNSDFQKILSNMISHNIDNPLKKMWLSTRKFMTTMKKATLGPDIKALEKQWVMGRGCPKGLCAFQYNKKRQQTEFVINQTLPVAERFTGSLCVRINELDGTYDHVVQVDEVLQGFDFECYSRLRKNRKKRYRYVNGDEIVVNLTNRDNPLLWIRVDPQLNWGPALIFKQPMYMWIFQLQMDRDYVAQLLAVNHIADEPTEGGVDGLKAALTNKEAVHFHRARAAAALALARVNKAADFSTMEYLIDYFKDYFYDEKKTMPLPNDFSDFVMYYLKMGLVTAIGNMRAKDGKSPKEVLEFLLELLRDNDNSLNDYSQYLYISTIIRALGGLDIEELVMTSTPRILAEVARFLKYDQLMPSFNFEVTVSCLEVACKLQLEGKAALDLEVFFRYSGYGQHNHVRLEAFRSLLLLASHNERVLMALTSLFADPHEPAHFKTEVVDKWVQLLREGRVTPAQFQTFLPKNAQLCDAIWALLCSEATAYDISLRMSLVVLYRTLWGRDTPHCLSVPPGQDDVLSKLAASASKASRQKKKRCASEAGLPSQSTIRISLKRQPTDGDQRVREDDEDAQPPPSTPLYSKPSRSRTRLRVTSGGDDDDDDEYVPPGAAGVRTPAPAPAPAPPEPEAPAVLSASSSGTKLKFTLRMSSGALPNEDATSSPAPEETNASPLPAAESSGASEPAAAAVEPQPLVDAVAPVPLPAAPAPPPALPEPATADPPPPADDEPVKIRIRLSTSSLGVDNSQ